MPRVHTVDHGDTLFGVALKFYGDGMKFPIIAEANGIRGRGFGTMGALVEDTTTGEILGLSNFHVTGPREDAFPDQIWQPQMPPTFIGGPPPAKDDFGGKVLRVDFPDTPPLPFSPIQVSMTDSAVFSTDGSPWYGRKERKFEMSLQVGSQGKFVADAQRALKRNGFVNVDRAGVYGGSTADAVRSFQSARGLPVTGVIDQSTWRALGLPGSVPRPVPID